MAIFTPEFKKQEELKSQMSLTPVELQRRFDLTSTPIVSNPASAPSITPASSITQNQYQYQPGENTEQYNARIAALRGETPTPAIGTSATIRNDELKAQADQIKADNEKAAELKRVSTQAEIDRIKSTTAPAGGAPPVVSGVKTFEDLYQGQGMPAAQDEITVIKNEEQTVIDELNSYKRKLSGIAGGTESIFAGKEGEAARIAQDRLDVLQRRETLLTDRYNTKLNYIKTISTLTQQDYTVAKQAYDDEYNRNFQIYQQYSTEKDRDVSAARASLQTILNTTKDSGVSLKDAISKNPLLGLQINEMETTLGYAEGTFSALASSNPTGKMLFNSLSEDKSQAFIAFQQPDGSIKTMVVNTGMAVGGGTTPIEIPEGASATENNRAQILNFMKTPKLSAAAKTDISKALGVINAVEDMANARQTEGFGGISPLNVLLDMEIPFTDVGLIPFREAARSKAGRENTGYIEAINLKIQYWASGAALTTAQTAQVNKFSPTTSDTDEAVRTKLNNLENFMLTQIRGSLQTEGIDFTPVRTNLFEVYEWIKKASPEQLKELKDQGLIK